MNGCLDAMHCSSFCTRLSVRYSMLLSNFALRCWETFIYGFPRYNNRRDKFIDPNPFSWLNPISSWRIIESKQLLWRHCGIRLSQSDAACSSTITVTPLWDQIETKWHSVFKHNYCEVLVGSDWVKVTQCVQAQLLWRYCGIKLSQSDAVFSNTMGWRKTVL